MGRTRQAAAARRSRRWGRRLLCGLGLLLALWLAGFLWFAARLPEAVSAPDRRTDAIVVLTGGSGRLDQGLRLLQDRHAARLFVSGVYPGVDVDELLGTASEASPALSCCIEIGYEAHTTRGNAAETARWIAARDIDSLRLVTAAYHMPRSLLEFRYRMPEVTIVPHPVFPEHVKQKAWWRWPGSAHLLIEEYTKYLITRLRLLLADAGA